MKDEIDKVSATEQSRRVVDENTKVVDLGYENFTLGVIHRGSTRNPAPAQTCGRKMDALPPGGTPGGIVHDFQVIVPPGVVHGWADIPDHVEYLSFRPSENVLQAAWVNPTIKK